jgi:hypothetical protein
VLSLLWFGALWFALPLRRIGRRGLDHDDRDQLRR